VGSEVHGAVMSSAPFRTEPETGATLQRDLMIVGLPG
jgi:hypothetical protein